MSGPTGLIFAMRSRYENQGGEEALFNEPDTGFSAAHDATAGAYTPRTGAGVGGDSEGNNPALLNDSSAGTYEVARGMSRENLERMGEADRLFREKLLTKHQSKAKKYPQQWRHTSKQLIAGTPDNIT